LKASYALCFEGPGAYATWDLLDARKLAPEHLLGKTPALDAHHKQVAQLVCKQIRHTRALSEHAPPDLRCDDAALIWLHPGTRHRCIDAYGIQYSWPSCFLAISSSIDTRLIRHGRTARSGRQSCHRNGDRRAAVWASGTGRATGQFSQWMTISSPASARVRRSGRRAFISAIFTAHVRSPSALERVHIPTLWSQRHAGPSILPKRLRRQNPESNNQAFFFIALTIKPTTAVTIAPVMPPPAS